MRIVGLSMLLLFTGSVGSGQENTFTLDSLAQSAEAWAKENLDEDVLRALGNINQEKLRKVMLDIQKELQGQYVIDLASLKQTAKSILPILERYEETQPYAIWLRTQLDYLEVADGFRQVAPPPKTEPGQTPKPAPNPPPQREREAWIQRLADRPWPGRAKAYVPLLKPIFAAQNVPPELIWIAEVESSFDPRARSPAGAAGLFQLMPVTAKRFGLAQRPLDERLQPEESARAAAKYLGLLHEQFKDWRLALAAYNAGEGTVQNLLARQKAASFDAIATRLPAETQMYVPRIEATLLRREGIKLGQL